MADSRKKLIGIVILNYNTWSETIKCIESITTFSNDENVHIYVVDNYSPQKPTAEELATLQSYKNAEIIFHDKNNGYSAGNNIGLKKALDEGCDYYLISNSDILFVDNSISAMRTFLDENVDAGVVGPQIYNVEDKFEPIHMLTKLTGWGKIKNMLTHTPLRVLVKDFEQTFIRDKELEAPLKVFGVSGCCFMVSRKCMEQLYPLDERTFLYEEEYIIGALLENLTYNAYVIPGTHVIHAQGLSTGKVSKFSYRCLIESEQIYLRDYLHTNVLVRYILLLIRQVILKRL